MENNSNKNLYIGIGIVLALLVGSFFYFTSLDTNNDDVDNKENTSENENKDDTAGSNADSTLLTTVAARSAQSVLASRLNVNASAVTLVEVESKDWPDGCLGLPRPGAMCTMAIVPGYKVTMSANGTTYVYRTNLSGTVVRSEN